MILQFKVKNFLSIREEQTLDFTASADKTYEDYAVVKIKGVRISKLGVVYGPNASGKSNILKALAWFIFYLVASRSKKPGTGTGLTPFMMDEDSRNRICTWKDCAGRRCTAPVRACQWKPPA